jgi:hypothetical protein
MLYLELFRSEYVEKSPINGVVIQRDTPYLINIYDYNISKIQDYYQEKIFAVKNTFILSRYIDHIPTDLNAPVENYIEQNRRFAIYLAKHFKFTSDIERGVVHNGYFYGEGNSEVILVDDSYFNPYEVELNWKTYPCLSVVQHNLNDINMLLPVSRNYGQRKGITVISFNPSILAIKYRQFLKQQRINESKGEPVLNKNHFMYRYVLPGILKSQTDHVFLNLLMDHFYNREEIAKLKYKLPFPIYKPYTQIDRWIKDTLYVLQNKNTNFINLLANITLPSGKNALQTLILPDVSPTVQVQWAMLLSRLKFMVFLIDVSKNKGQSRNFINDWKNIVKRIQRSFDYGILFSYEETKEIEGLMEHILTA